LPPLQGTGFIKEGPEVFDEFRKPISLPSKPAGLGAYGTVYIDTQNGSAVKIFHPYVSQSSLSITSVNNEISFYEQYGGQAGIPKLKGFVYDAQNNLIGYQQEFIPGQTLNDFYRSGGRLTQGQIDEAVNELKQIQNITGRAHGDLATKGKVDNTNNIIIQPDGRVRFIDFSGLDPNGLTTPQIRQDELNSLQQGLQLQYGQ